MSIACYDPATGNILGVERRFLDVFNDLSALSAAQKNAVWADFTSGVPAKWALDEGANAKALAAASGLAIDLPVSGGWTAALQTAARLKMVAIYLFDRPLYLASPAWWPGGAAGPAPDVRPYV